MPYNDIYKSLRAKGCLSLIHEPYFMNLTYISLALFPVSATLTQKCASSSSSVKNMNNEESSLMYRAHVKSTQSSVSNK